MDKGPDLLLDSAKVAFGQAVKVNHVEEVLWLVPGQREQNQSRAGR